MRNLNPLTFKKYIKYKWKVSLMLHLFVLRWWPYFAFGQILGWSWGPTLKLILSPVVKALFILQKTEGGMLDVPNVQLDCGTSRKMGKWTELVGIIEQQISWQCCLISWSEWACWTNGNLDCLVAPKSLDFILWWPWMFCIFPQSGSNQLVCAVTH